MRLVTAPPSHPSAATYQRAPAVGPWMQQMQETMPAVAHRRPVPPPFHVLERRFGRLLADRWGVPCEGAFEHLLAIAPGQLAILIELGGLRHTDLTFAAEVFGGHVDSELVRRTLLPLLRHEEAVVREGALYGLGNHLDAASRLEVQRVIEADASPGVRQAAKELLDEP